MFLKENVVHVSNRAITHSYKKHETISFAEKWIELKFILRKLHQNQKRQVPRFCHKQNVGEGCTECNMEIEGGLLEKERPVGEGIEEGNGT